MPTQHKNKILSLEEAERKGGIVPNKGEIARRKAVFAGIDRLRDAFGPVPGDAAERVREVRDGTDG